MKLYMRQKVFSWTDRFTVWDEGGRERYTVEGELFSWGKKLHVYDAGGAEAAFIQQKALSFLPRFFVFLGENQAAEIVKEFTFFRPRYSIRGLDWQVDGSFMAHDYQITQGGSPVASIHKEWFTFGDCYAIDIGRPEDETLALSVVLCIDCVLAMDSNN